MGHPQIRVRRRELHRIDCPYCEKEGRAGHGIFTVIRNGSDVEGNAKDPIKCLSCGQFFLVQPIVKLIGKPLEAAETGVVRRNGYVR